MAEPRRGADSGAELLTGPAKAVLALAFFPAVVVGKLAAALRVPWYASALGSAFALFLVLRRHGVTWQTTEYGPTLQAVGLHYATGWFALWTLGTGWYQQAVAAAGLLPSGRLGEVWGRVSARIAVPTGGPPVEPAMLLAAAVYGMAPLGLVLGLALGAVWEYRRPRKVWAADVSEDQRIRAARWRVPVWTWLRARKPGAHPKAGVLLGYTLAGRAFVLAWKELRRHVLITGTTGSGKTQAMLRVCDAAVEAGHGLAAVDFKGDPALRDRFAGYPGALVWTFGGAYNLDVLAGDPTQVADKLTAAESWGEGSTFYRPLCWGYAQMVAKLLKLRDGRDAPVNPWEVWKLLDPAAFQQELREVVRLRPDLNVASALSPDLSQSDLEAGLGDYDSDHAQRALAGFRLKLGGMLQSAAGERFGPARDGRETIDLAQAVRDKRPVLLSINANAYQEVSRRAAVWVFLEVRRVVGEMQAERWGERGHQGLLVVDELNAIGQEAVGLVPLFETARGAGVGLLIGTTGLSTILRLPGHAADAVDQNTPTKIVMQQEGREDRKAWVEAFGHRDVTERPRRLADDGSVTEAGTLRSTRRPVVAAEELAALATGQALVKRGGGVTRVVVAYRQPVLPAWVGWLVRAAGAAYGKARTTTRRAQRPSPTLVAGE